MICSLATPVHLIFCAIGSLHPVASNLNRLVLNKQVKVQTAVPPRALALLIEMKTNTLIR